MTPPTDREPLPTVVNGLPPLPDEYAAVLAAGLRALGDDAPSDEALTAIADHVRLLLAWNAVMNLSGIREAGAMALEHVLDSLAALPLLRRAGVTEFVDIGSGGGFPGLTLAVALPARSALLVESVAKKARFLETAAACAGVADRVGVAATRVEMLAADPRHRGRWHAVTARAVADLPELAELALPLLRERGLLVAWKRLPLDDELGRAYRAVPQLGGRVGVVEPAGIAGLEDHVLVVIEKIAPTPARFPRDPAARKRAPLGGVPGASAGPSTQNSEPDSGPEAQGRRPDARARGLEP
jgi:16S rRNA (guanine527-N7)-methyltransferase